ncbi:MAG: MATE family efflux transporter [Bacteroidales bacterium]|jgi:putative MATE family efflux protein|nr:MATE family efflux transporter [Bacteroidales bacterium]
MDKIQELETKSIGSLLLTYALPAVITQVVASIYNIVDRVFLGQYVGALAIAGLAITMPVMNIIHALGSLVGVGASSRMSIVLGRKDMRWAEKILGNSMLLTFFFGFLFVTGGYLFMDNILELFGASPDTISYAREYMQIVLPGMFFTTMTFNLTGLIRASGYPTKSMWIMASGAVLNIFLDALFISVLGWGISGAAWATTISMFTTAVIAVSHFITPSSFIRFKRHAWTPKLYIFRNVLLIGLSPFLMNFAASFVVALLNKQLIRFGGDLAVGAYGIVNTYASFLVMFILGLCQGMQPIAGYNYGAGHNHRLRSVYLLTMRVSVIVGTVGALLAMIIPRIILRAFTDSDALLDIGAPAMRYLNVMMPLIAFTITNSQFFQSIDKPWIAITTSLSRQVLFLIPLMFIIPAIMVNAGGDGLTGVWVTCTICDVLGAALAAGLLMSQLKVFRPGYVAPVRRPRKEAGPKENDK